jgi:nucleoid DNA-binding protein
MMNAKDFSRAYAERYGVPYKYAMHDCEKFWELLSKLLYEDKENITIYGVGSFKQLTKKEKKVRHPITKEIMTIPESVVIKFLQTSSIVQE